MYIVHVYVFNEREWPAPVGTQLQGSFGVFFGRLVVPNLPKASSEQNPLIFSLDRHLKAVLSETNYFTQLLCSSNLSCFKGTFAQHAARFDSTLVLGRN